MNPDAYYGRRAANYDKERAHKAFWQKEQSFVERNLTQGPVLDIPVGTGRYFEIYNRMKLPFKGVDISADMLEEARKKDAKANLEVGTIYDIKEADGSYGTVVASRIIHWLYPDEMKKAMSEICRVGKDVIVSVRLGKEGVQPGLKTYTHDELKFLNATGNKLLVARKTIRMDGGASFDLFKFRDVDPEQDFKVQLDGYKDGRKAIDRLAAIWCRRFGVPAVKPSTEGRITVEYWNGERFGTVLSRLQFLAAKERSIHDIITTLSPRRTEKPPVYFRSKGHYGLLDGRRRSNKYSREGGIHPVIVINFDD